MLMLVIGVASAVAPASGATGTSSLTSEEGARSQAELEALQQVPRPHQFVLPEASEQTTSPPAPPKSANLPAGGEVGQDGLNPTEAVPGWASHRFVHFDPPHLAAATADHAKGSGASPAITGLQGEKLTYWGGPVQHEPQLYLLFWGERFWKGESAPQGLGAELEFFFRGLEKESLVNPAWQGIMAQYWSYTDEPNTHARVLGESHLNAVLAPKGVTDAEVRQEIDYWIENGAKVGPNTQFIVMLAPGSTFSELSGCAYHTVGEFDGKEYAYSVVPYSGDADVYYKSAGACNRLQWKTKVGEVQQLMWSTTGAASHEFAESVTDSQLWEGSPYTSRWAWDENLSGDTEIADLCIDEEEAGREHAIEELPAKNGRVGWTYVNKLWDDEGGNRCKLEDPPAPPPPEPVKTRNALANASFGLEAESGGCGNPTDWTPYPEGGTENRCAYVNEARAEQGDSYAEMNDSAEGGSLAQDFSVAPQIGQTYYFSVWLRAPEGAVKGTVALWAMNANGSGIEHGTTNYSLTGGGGWQEITVPLTITSTNGVKLRAQVYEQTKETNLDLDGAQLSNGNAANGVFGLEAESGGCGNPTDWTPYPNGGTENRCAYMNEARAEQGDSYAEMNDSAEWGSLAQDVLVAPQVGQTYYFSVWLRAPESAVKGQIWLYEMNSTGEVVERSATNYSLTGGSGWEEISVPLTITTTSGVKLRAQVYEQTKETNLELDGAQVIKGNLANASFGLEASSGGCGNPTDWTPYPNGGTENRCAYVNESRAEQGDSYAEMNDSSEWGSLAQDVLVAPQVGQTYYFSVWLRAPERPVKGEIAVYEMNSAGEPVDQSSTDYSLTAGGSWEEISVPLTITTTSGVKLRAQVYEQTKETNLDLDGAELR